MQLGFLAYVVPFAFCYDPGLLMQGGWMKIAWSLISGVGSVFAFACMWMGYIKSNLPLWLRGLLGVAGVLCLSPIDAAVVAGLILVVGAYLYSKHLSARAMSA